MEMKHVDALIRALVNETERTQRESLGDLLRTTLQREEETERSDHSPWDDLGLDKRALRTEEEIRRDGFELARRFEYEVYQTISRLTERYNKRMTPEHISQYPRGTASEYRYSDIKITGFNGSDLVRGFFEVKSHRSERVKDLDTIARLPYQISELQKEAEDDTTRAFIICGRYALPVPEMLEFDEVLPHYTLDIYEIDPIDGAILTDVSLEETVKAFTMNLIVCNDNDQNN
tara:strand:+ start:515 stop:1210 length:696 start_codon:yes stop_codon:yes gene_type:complete